MKKMDINKYECPQLRIEEIELSGFLCQSDFGVGVDESPAYYGDSSNNYEDNGDLTFEYYQ